MKDLKGCQHRRPTTRLSFLACSWFFPLVLWQLSVAPTAVAAPDTTNAAADPASETDEELYFEKHVRPILKVHCFLCHGEEPEKGGELDLRLARLILQGGDSGPAMEPGQPSESLLVQRVLEDEMPPGPKKLSDTEKRTLSKWVELGGKTLRAEPDDPHDARFTEEELLHWSFQPIRRPELPSDPSLSEYRSPIDRFIAYTAAQQGFRLAPPADRRVLLRRLSFNLIGLPPTPEEIEAFLADESESAYESMVERLLASPHYGERWGRHWLDVAGFAESDGQIVGDQHRPHAWRYREYVVDALNRDLPYSQFITEQLAGDEMIDGPPDPNNDEHARLLAATGFLQMAPDVSQTENTLLNRNQAVADTIQTVTSALLGLSVACAQCHDHRYDPITIEDYYQLRAVFDPAMPIQNWKQPNQRLVDMTNDATKAERDKIEADAVAKQEDINSRRKAHCQTIQDREIDAAPEDVRKDLREAVNTPPEKQSEAQKALLEKYPKVRTIDWIVGQLVEYDGPTHRAFQEEEKKVAELRESKPLDRRLMAVQEVEPNVSSHVFFRGDPQSPQKEVQPKELEVLIRHRPDLPDDSTNKERRRLAYARQLVDGTHPMVARVIVNRVWQHHFGRGLVSTPGDFGLNGQPPSHPELLDYLADAFMANGWSLKWLHRQIVHSQTFQQVSGRSSDSRSEAESASQAVIEEGEGTSRDSWAEDPDNRFLARTSLRRLDAEAVRDAILSVSGQLNPRAGGPSVPVAEDDEGKSVIGTRLLRDGLFAGIKDAGEEAKRRSLYLSSKRALPLNLLQTFDLPEMKPNCQQRGSSTVTPQALLLLNDEWAVQSAEQMAERLWAAAGSNDRRIELAFELAFCSSATQDEIVACSEFIDQQVELFQRDADEKWQEQLQQQPDAAQRRAIASLCQMLMASNRFLYLE